MAFMPSKNHHSGTEIANRTGKDLPIDVISDLPKTIWESPLMVRT
jgi:hypothetical protein